MNNLKYKIFKVNNLLFFFRKAYKNSVIFNLKTNGIVCIINGLSGEYILKLKNSYNLLIKDNDKLTIFNYKIMKVTQ